MKLVYANHDSVVRVLLQKLTLVQSKAAFCIRCFLVIASWSLFKVSLLKLTADGAWWRDYLRILKKGGTGTWQRTARGLWRCHDLSWEDSSHGIIIYHPSIIKVVDCPWLSETCIPLLLFWTLFLASCWSVIGQTLAEGDSIQGYRVRSATNSQWELVLIIEWSPIISITVEGKQYILHIALSRHS